MPGIKNGGTDVKDAFAGFTWRRDMAEEGSSELEDMPTETYKMERQGTESLIKT